MLTIADIDTKFNIDCENGKIYYKHNSTKSKYKSGDEAGYIQTDGYLKVSIKDKKYYNHQIIFFYYNHYWPKKIIHNNSHKFDNRISNLYELKYDGSVTLTQDMLWECLSYNSLTGIFKYKLPSINYSIGDIATNIVDTSGYIQIAIYGRNYKAHRLAWFYVYGVWPNNLIDHIDGDRTNNAISNLRDVTAAENGQNLKTARVDNKSGYLGVSKHQNKWKAQITVNGKRYRLGLFNTPKEASEAYLKAKEQLHPKYLRPKHPMTRSAIFINSLTCIDHGVLTESGIVVGGSYMYSIIIEGNIPEDDPEQVVIDFSKCKKLIKAYIDDNENGFDHKLWVNPKYCNITEDGNRYFITTPYTDLNLPKNGVKLISYDDILEQINIEVQAHLRIYYPNINIKTESKLSKVSDTPPNPNVVRKYFNYIHGLKDSSSFGCQTLHGHTSYYEYLCDDKDVILPDYTNIVFIFDKNITRNDDWITIEYTTPERGYFKYSLNKNEYEKFGVLIWIIDTETTIEHLVNNIYTDFIGDINKIKYLVTSEGLQKGARYIAPNL